MSGSGLLEERLERTLPGPQGISPGRREACPGGRLSLQQEAYTPVELGFFFLIDFFFIDFLFLAVTPTLFMPLFVTC